MVEIGMNEIMPKLTIEYPNGLKITGLCVEVNPAQNLVKDGERADLHLSVIGIRKIMPEAKNEMLSNPD